MAHVTPKHGNRSEHGNVVSMAIQSHGGSGNRAGKTKVLGGSLQRGMSVVQSVRLRGGKRGLFGWGQHMYFGGKKNESYEAAIRGSAAQQLHSDSGLLFAFVADNQCF